MISDVIIFVPEPPPTTRMLFFYVGMWATYRVVSLMTRKDKK